MTLGVRSWIRASCDLITCLSVSLSSVTSMHLFFSVHPYLFECPRLPVGDEDAEEGGPVSSAARVVGWRLLRKSTSQQTVHSVSSVRVHYLRCSLWDLCCHSVNLHSKLYLYTFLFLFIHWFIWLMFDYLWSAKTCLLGVQCWRRYGACLHMSLCFRRETKKGRQCVLFEILGLKDSCGTMGSEKRARHIRLEVEGTGNMEDVILEVTL